MTDGARFLVVNADDLGMSDGINAGILRAHRDGIVTSASLMVLQPRAREAAVLARDVSLGLGLHIDLSEWEPVNGELTRIYARVDVADRPAVLAEIVRQIELFIELTGRPPDHLDSHQHVHNTGPAREASIAAARKLEVPLRGVCGGVLLCGGFYGQGAGFEPYPEGITLDNLLRLLDAMPAGWNELSCHPGLAYDVRSAYALERETELETLCRPELRRALVDRGIALRNFSQIGVR